jgi:hypothetical protein
MTKTKAVHVSTYLKKKEEEAALLREIGYAAGKKCLICAATFSETGPGALAVCLVCANGAAAGYVIDKICEGKKGNDKLFCDAVSYANSKIHSLASGSLKGK